MIQIYIRIFDLTTTLAHTPHCQHELLTQLNTAKEGGTGALRLANQIYIEVIRDRVAPRRVNHSSRVIGHLIGLDCVLNF